MAQINRSNLESLIQKLNMYKEEESINFESINSELSILNSYYKTKNSSNLENIKTEISNKNNTINTNNNNNINVFNNIIMKYISTARDVANDFDNIV
ncbi:MAG: hypothetical protein IJ565_01385 [Bacilli bacterium]|nr:hypothetical protein [Bacilli bacterium]